jgi:Gas vesicle synthesis protein GvpO
MAETGKEEAKRRRAEGRRRRREGAQDEGDETQSAEQGNSETPEPLESVKHAARVAAAAAAVGAAVGAARALTGNGSDDEDEPAEPATEQEREPEQEQQPEPAAEQPQPPPQEPEEQRQPEREERPRYDEGRPAGASPDEARRVVASAREALSALLGKEPETVSGLDRNGDGWLVTLEVVELQRIPESTDVLASYELELDGDRKLVRYQRGRRYYRSQANDGDTS